MAFFGPNGDLSSAIRANPAAFASLGQLAGPGTFGQGLQRASAALQGGIVADQRMAMDQQRMAAWREEKERKEEEYRRKEAERQAMGDYYRANAPTNTVVGSPLTGTSGMPPLPGLGSPREVLTPQAQQIAKGPLAPIVGEEMLNQHAGIAGDGKYGTTAHWGYDAEGNWVPFQLHTQGKTRTVNLPGIIPVPPGDISAAKAQGAAVGGSRGEARGTLESMTSKLPYLQAVVGELRILGDEATYTAGGQAVNWTRRQFGYEPTAASVAREKYIAKVNNQVLPLLRDTFGAQFTVEEGNALRATLGDVDKAPEEKKAILDAFIEQKIYTIMALAGQTGQAMPTFTGGIPAGASVSPPGGAGSLDAETEALVDKYGGR